MIDEYGNVVPDPISASDVLNEPVSNHPVLANLKEQVATLQKNYDDMRDRYWNSQAAIEALKSNVKEILIECVSNETIDVEIAKRIAEAMDIEVTKRVIISGTITFSGYAEVSMFEEHDSISYDTDINCLDISYDGYSLDSLDYELEDAELEEYGN